MVDDAAWTKSRSWLTHTYSFSRVAFWCVGVMGDGGDQLAFTMARWLAFWCVGVTWFHYRVRPQLEVQGNAKGSFNASACSYFRKLASYFSHIFFMVRADWPCSLGVDASQRSCMLFSSLFPGGLLRRMPTIVEMHDYPAGL